MLPHPDVWRGGQGLAREPACVATGWPELSAQLPGGGWPRGALVEILLPHTGCGEWQLLQPALLPGERPVALVRPPHIPQAAAWEQGGGDIARLLWVKASQDGDALWAAEQILRSSALDALLLWQGAAEYRQLHRLHLAAQGCHSLFFMLRPQSMACQPSPAALRLALMPLQGGSFQVSILKRRGGWASQAVRLPMAGQAGMPLASLLEKESHAGLARRASGPSRTGCLSPQHV
ncbi:translesion DNA synthesis-associated protein ImuA [Kerstersia gyiorum]|uniref:translesion DNA synthesis-associated protein ImuA n=1 Tax=Kerstersia gyiorum TaxID=206506 RepID=UPI0014316F3A|nr:translesion DNA synthesis-associated protein ImuA [Kerstersia gyiorum]